MFSGSKAPESALQLANRSSGSENCHTRAGARGASARVHTQSACKRVLASCAARDHLSL